MSKSRTGQDPARTAMVALDDRAPGSLQFREHANEGKPGRILFRVGTEDRMSVGID